MSVTSIYLGRLGAAVAMLGMAAAICIDAGHRGLARSGLGVFVVVLAAHLLSFGWHKGRSVKRHILARQELLASASPRYAAPVQEIEQWLNESA